MNVFCVSVTSSLSAATIVGFLIPTLQYSMEPPIIQPTENETPTLVPQYDNTHSSSIHLAFDISYLYSFCDTLTVEIGHESGSLQFCRISNILCIESEFSIQFQFSSNFQTHQQVHHHRNGVHRTERSIARKFSATNISARQTHR